MKERMNGTSIDWSAQIRTVRDKLSPVLHQKIEVFDGKAHILTFKGISNPVIYDHWGNPMAQINKEYLSTDIERMRAVCKRNDGNDTMSYDIENY
jgi:hypothetical protein